MTRGYRLDLDLIVEPPAQLFPHSHLSMRLHNTLHKTLDNSLVVSYSTPMSYRPLIRRAGYTAAAAATAMGAFSSQPYLTESTPKPAVVYRATLTDIRQQLNKRQLDDLLTDDKVNAVLRQYEESYFVDRGNGIVRYDVNQLSSNNPLEDDRVEQIVVGRGGTRDDTNTSARDAGDWVFFGVFDGHSGWTTLYAVANQLVDYVLRELAPLYLSSTLLPTLEAVDSSIARAFLRLDHKIVHEDIEPLLNSLDPKITADTTRKLFTAVTGSCALLSFYNALSKLLKVAVTGDLRALLGLLNGDLWTVRQLSVDQTGANPDEAERIRAEHPDEPRVINNGRVCGYEPLRMFGDSRLKWSLEHAAEMNRKFLTPRNGYTWAQLPPYVTAEPVVTTTTIHPENHDFLVMALDGLYEFLTNEEIAGLVVLWMAKQKLVPASTAKSDALTAVKDISGYEDSLKLPIRSRGFTSDITTVDDNVLTHLIRNALSRGHPPRPVNHLLSIPGHMSRRYRDDLTVTVVFFGQGGDAPLGKVSMNPHATKGGIHAPTKL